MLSPYSYFAHDKQAHTHTHTLVDTNHVQDLPSFFSTKEQEQANWSWRRWFALRVFSHNQIWDGRWCWMMQPVLVFKATSCAQATLQCHYNILQMSWKIKQVQHPQRSTKTLCTSAYVCVHVSLLLASCPVTLHSNVNNWHYYDCAL